MKLAVILLFFGLLLWLERTLYLRAGFKDLGYDISLSAMEVFEGDTIEIVEVVCNRRGLPVPWLKTEFCVSKWLAFNGIVPRTVSGYSLVPSIFMLRPNQKCTRKWQVTCLKRGVFDIDAVTMSGSDMFGFISFSKTIPVDVHITVLPTPLDVMVPQLSKEEFFGNIVARRFICDDPFLISGTRSYSGREPLNKIHWNSTARAQSLMVYNNDFTTFNSMLILLNVQHSADTPFLPASDTDIERFIKIAALFLQGCLAAGQSVSIASNAANADGLESAPPQITPAYCHGLLRRLARLENACAEDFAALLSRLSYYVYTDIVIITPYISEGMGQFSRRMKRHRKNVVFYSYNTNAALQALPVY